MNVPLNSRSEGQITDGGRPPVDEASTATREGLSTVLS